MNSLVVAYGDKIGASAYEVIIVELSTLIRFSLLLGFAKYWNEQVLFYCFSVIVLLICLCVSDSDLHMTALALELCCTLMADKRSSPNVGLAVRNKVLPQALALIKSSLLQGQALVVLCIFLEFFLCCPKWFNVSNLCLVDIVGFTELFCCFSLFCKYEFWHSAGLSSFKC